MAGKRTYGDACGIARALDITGERWSLMIVRELLLGPKRFSDLRAGLPTLGPDVLSQRLRDLSAAGVLRRRRLPPPVSAQVYELTDLGTRLEPVLSALGNWGALLPLPAGCEPRMSFDSHVLSLRTLFDADRAAGWSARIALELDDQPFAAEVADGRFTIVRGEHSGADARITGDPGTVIAVAHGRLALDDALATASLRIDGDEDSARRFLTMFPLPEPVTT